MLKGVRLIPWFIVAMLVSGCTALPKTAPAATAASQGPDDSAAYIRAHYTKRECRIPMRDGVKLYTAVYTPRSASDTHPCPILIKRTPYSCDPYGPDTFPDKLGPSTLFLDQGYIFVNQDVRGCYMSEGEFN